MRKTIKVIAHLVVIPEKKDEVKSILSNEVNATVKENGCIQYQLFQNNEESNKFTFIEEWENAEVLTIHSKTEHSKELRMKLKNALLEKPDIRRYSLIK